MKKKIALMTWHHVKNYGTALQAYALKKTLENLGYHVDLIDYRRSETGLLNKISFINIVKNKLFIHKNKDEKYKIPFECFEKFYNDKFTYTSLCKYNNDFYELLNNYDGFVCGSDQIWGPEWLDGRYFLDFVSDPSRKIAYAASLGVSYLDDKNIRDELHSLLNSFTNISIREETGCKLVNKILHKEIAKNVVDPVLLVNPDIWYKMKKKSKEKEAYTLLFFLKYNRNYFNDIMKNNSCNKLKIFHSTQSDDNPYANIDGMTPEEFLCLIANAERIYTDSYHVMLFSIIFNKQFTIYIKDVGCKNTKQSRIVDLLKLLELEYLLKRESDNSYIDYNIVNKKIHMLRLNSLKYLEECLDNIPNNRPPDYFKECEKKCSGKCYSAQFIMREKSVKGYINKYLFHHIKKWNFSCDEECYRCKIFNESNANSNVKKPLFYKDLNNKLANEKYSLLKIYFEFYFFYDCVNFVKKLLRKKY